MRPTRCFRLASSAGIGAVALALGAVVGCVPGERDRASRATDDGVAVCDTGTCPPAALAFPQQWGDVRDTLDPEADRSIPALRTAAALDADTVKPAPRRPAGHYVAARPRAADAPAREPAVAPVSELLPVSGAAGAVDFFPTGAPLREGDILLGRSYGLVGAAISGSGETPGPFSHAAMYYRDAAGVGRVLNFRPGGLESGAPAAFFDRYNRLGLVRLAAPAPDARGFSIESLKWLERDRRERIQPDFRLDHDDPSTLYCLELISHIYRDLGLPDPFGRHTPVDGDSLLRHATALFGLPIYAVASPNSVLNDPRFAIVAEWLRPDYDLHREALNEALVDRIFEYLAQGYTPRDPGPGTRLKVNMALLSRSLHNAATFWRPHTPLPDYIDRRDIGRGLVMYAHVDHSKNRVIRDLDLGPARPRAAKADPVRDPAGDRLPEALDREIREIARVAADFFRDRFYVTPPEVAAPALTAAALVPPNPRRERRPAAPTVAAVPHRFGDILALAPSALSAPDVTVAAPVPVRLPVTAEAPPLVAFPSEGRWNSGESMEVGIVYWTAPVGFDLADLDRPTPATLAHTPPATAPVSLAAAATAATATTVAAVPSASGEKAGTNNGTVVAALPEARGGLDPQELFEVGFTWSWGSVNTNEPRRVYAAALPPSVPSPRVVTEDDRWLSAMLREVMRAPETVAPAKTSAFAAPDAPRARLLASASRGTDGTPADAAGISDAGIADGIPGVPTLAALVTGDDPSGWTPSRSGADIEPPSLLTRRQLSGIPPSSTTPAAAGELSEVSARSRANPFLTPEEDLAESGDAPLRAEDLPALPAPKNEARDVFAADPVAARLEHAAMIPPARPATGERRPGVGESVRPESPAVPEGLMPMVPPASPISVRNDDEWDGPDAPSALPPPATLASAAGTRTLSDAVSRWSLVRLLPRDF